MFLLVPADLGSAGQRAVKRSLLLFLFVYACAHYGRSAEEAL